MAEFVYLFRGGDSPKAPSPDEMEKHMQRWLAWMKDLRESGHFKSGEPLAGGGKTVRGASKAVTDGPYAEAKDLVGGFMLVEAKDLAEAVELSKRCPILERPEGSVEVRPVQIMNVKM